MPLASKKSLLWLGGLCLLLAADLAAQNGLGAAPGGGSGRGGARGSSGERIALPGSRIPTPVSPQDGGLGNPPGSLDSSRPARPSPPTGNILSPGSPSSNNPGDILSPGLPGRPYNPGNVITPGTPPRPVEPQHPGGISSRPGRTGHDFRNGYGRRGNTVILYYPYAYSYGSYGYGYANDGSYVDNGMVSSGGVTRTNPSVDYTIEGPLDESTPREPHSRVYEVHPDSEKGAAGLETAPGNSEARVDQAQADAAENPVYLIALKGGLIYAATEHWMLGNTVHFVTPQGEHYVISLPEVDLDLSARLNRERGLKFVLEVREKDSPAPVTVP